jgi:hypothetical protein
MVSRVAFAFFVGHDKLLLIALPESRSNDNANAALKNLVAEMLPRIVLKLRVVLEFLGPFKPRPGSPRRLSVALASRCDRLCKGPKASTEWSIAKHQWDFADLLDNVPFDFNRGTHGNTAEQMISM